jgi:hypothetical protein
MLDHLYTINKLLLLNMMIELLATLPIERKVQIAPFPIIIANTPLKSINGKQINTFLMGNAVVVGHLQHCIHDNVFRQASEAIADGLGPIKNYHFLVCQLEGKALCCYFPLLGVVEVQPLLDA